MKNLIVSKSEINFLTRNNLSHLQLLLSNLNHESNNQLEEMEWRFETFTINFHSTNSLSETHYEWCEKIQFSIVWLVKILFLESIDTGNSTTSLKNRFESIIKTIYFLAERSNYVINKSDLQEYYCYLLMNNLHKGYPAKRLTPINFQSLTRFISIRKWIQIKKLYKLPEIGFISSYSDSTINNALKEAIDTLSGGDLTFRDWKEGGSFNNLTLDYGKFYVEHCSDFFENHINIAIALRRTLDQSKDIIELAGLKHNFKNQRQFYNPIIFNFLSGNDVDELPPSYIKKSSNRTLKLIQTITLNKFSENYLQLWVLKELLSESIICRLSDSINSSRYEIIRHVVEIRWAILNKDYEPSQSAIKTLEFDALRNIINSEFDLDLLIYNIDIQHQRLVGEYKPLILNKAMYENFGIKKISNKFQVVTNYINLVESAGIVKFLALTGWRESELGFTIKDLRVEPNLDLLDQSNCSVRYTINWFIPKTNATTKVNREITHSCYQCVLKLAQLVDSKDRFPCLYRFRELAIDPFASSGFIKNRCSGMWFHFVEYYYPFVQLTLLSELKKIKLIANPTEAESKRLQFLSEKYAAEEWDKISQDILLNAAHLRSKQEFTRVDYFLKRDLRKGFIWRCRSGTMSQAEYEIAEKFLSPETKAAIQQFQSQNEISPAFTAGVVNEIMADCLYPTPHAFRHMWAEAVYRRFDGDVGWLIRSNFKHISQNMWLAYIRNKDNRRQHQKIKRQVISSLLNNYVAKKGVGYAGATDKLLRRLFLKTKTLSIDELGNLVGEFSRLEIEDIKSNPWGFCILRTRTQLTAKCFSHGAPQRQNASPSLCLGCTNNLIQNGNIEGILLGISNDIRIIQNPKIPTIFRKVSYQTVTNAHKQLKKLDVDIESLQELENALSIAKESFIV